MVTRWSRCRSNFCALIGQNLIGEFMRKIYAASGKLFTYSWSWQSFVSCCVAFNCLFPLDVQKEIQLLSRFFCYSCLVCLLGFWLRNTLLVKVTGNPFRMASCSGLTWWLSGAASRLVSLSNYFIWCLLFFLLFSFSGFIKLSVVMRLCTLVRFETMIWPSIRLKLTEL